MASARNLCQHSDTDGTQCTSNDYVLCPHCQLQLCLKHLNIHQDLLRSDLYILCDQVDCTRLDLDNLIFDPMNRRQELHDKLDNWYHERLNLLNKTYTETKQQLQILCLQSHIEFDTYKTKQDKQLKQNLMKQLRKVYQQRQVHIDELNEMKFKLNTIQRGLNELKQLLVNIDIDPKTYDIQVTKRRYIDAAKPSFNDDDDNVWNIDDDDESNDNTKSSDDIQILEDLSTASNQHSQLPDIIMLPSPIVSSSCPSTTIAKKEPLKIVIKRLQQSPTSKNIQCKLKTVSNTTALIT